MLQLCKEGPPNAYVSSIEFIPHAGPVAGGFRVRPSV
jgi:hypothetical protein